MGRPAIRAEGLGKTYRIAHDGAPYRTLREDLGRLVRLPLRRGAPRRETLWALRDISFDLEPGETLGVIGRNGAGKSTLLKILARITRPTTGYAEIRGTVGSLLEVGTGFHQELTGRENIFLNGAILGMTRRDIHRRFDEIVAFAEVERFLDTPVKRFSTGMYMRLAFSVAAHLRPEVLLIDEVLAVGDAAFQKKCLGKMGDIAREGRTIIFVSHNLQAVGNLCRSGLVVDKGTSPGKTDVQTAILRYSQQIAGQVQETAVISGDLTLHAFDVLQGGRPLTEYDAGQPIDLRLKFTLARDRRDFRIGVFLKTPMEEVISRSLVADWNPDRVDVPRGTYVLEGRIPADFLASGCYVLAPHASVFDVVDYGLEDLLRREIQVRAPARYNRAYPREVARRLTGAVLFDAGWRLTHG